MKFKHAYLIDDITIISESFQYNGLSFIKKPKLNFGFFDRIFGSIGVLFGRFYPIYFADDYLKENKKEVL